MKNAMRAMTVLLLAVVLFYAGVPALAGDKKLLVAGDEEKEGSHLLEITDVVFRTVGYDPKFVLMPWVRALSGTISGQYDVLLGAYYTEERARHLLYSNPIGSSEVVLLKLKSRNITFKTVEDLKPYKIGAIRSSRVSDAFDKAEKEYLQMEYATDTLPHIKKLLAGRLDLVVEKKTRLQYLLHTVFKDYAHLMDYVRPSFDTNYYHICVSKQNPDGKRIIADFNRGLQMIRDNGTFKKILDKYGIEEE